MEKTAGLRIKKLREQKHWTQKDLGKRVHESSQVISNWERGYSRIDDNDMARLAQALGTSSSFLVGDTDDPRPLTDLVANDRIPLKYVPLIGRIVAGEPLLSAQNLEGSVPIPSELDCDFALLVVGDSMAGAGLDKGDIVFCVRSNRIEPQSGDMVVALVNGIENTLKWLLQAEDGNWYLRADNPKYRDIPLMHNDDRIQAVVVSRLKLGRPKFGE